MDKDLNFFFIFGMIRSGTTYLTKLLNESKNISAISDPYLHFFKSYRNEIYKKNLNEFDNGYPLDNHFCSKYEKINKIIENSDFSELITSNTLNRVISNIKVQAKRDSENVLHNIDKIKANNYSELLEKLFEQIYLNYNKKNLTHVGFKSTFCEQFTSTLYNKNNNYKFIFIIRDPRSVYASHINEHEKQYPLLFIIRNWRKSIFYALKSLHKFNNSIIIKYEDLVENKKYNLNKIFNFLNINEKNYDFYKEFFSKDNGENWLSNSSFSKVNTDQNEPNWKKVLSNSQITLIETFTSHELNYFGYNKYSNLDYSKIEFNQVENQKNFYDWIKKFSVNEYLLNEKNLINEFNRNELLSKKIKLSENMKYSYLISDQLCDM
jgi:hypothetical protein